MIDPTDRSHPIVAHDGRREIPNLKTGIRKSDWKWNTCIWYVRFEISRKTSEGVTATQTATYIATHIETQRLKKNETK